MPQASGPDVLAADEMREAAVALVETARQQADIMASFPADPARKPAKDTLPMRAVLEVLLFSAALVVVLILISKRFSGWGELHWHFGCDEDGLKGQPIQRFRIASLRMNRYLLSAQVRIYPEGMWLAPNWLYFNFHPVFIPWSAIHFAGISWYGFASTLFRVDGCDAALCFAGWQGRKVEAAMRRMQEDQFVQAARLGVQRQPFRVPTVF